MPASPVLPLALQQHLGLGLGLDLLPLHEHLGLLGLLPLHEHLGLLGLLLLLLLLVRG